MNGISSAEAQSIMNGQGLACNWWRRARHISPAEIDGRLTSAELDLHVNSYDEKHPARSGMVWEETPFISLAAGSVERHKFLKTNEIHPAHRTALYFASDFGKPGECFLFYCWVVVALRPSVAARQLAEEVRELNTYRSYSAYQAEGEILAKIEVPARQIHRYERYQISRDRLGRLRISYPETSVNQNYIQPDSVTNFRDWF
jgi:hypothetical protein